MDLPLLIVGGQLLYIVGSFVSFPLRRKQKVIFDIPNIRSQPIVIKHQPPAFLILRAPGAAALSDRCPHLGCQVHYQQDHDLFVCPCHGSTFNQQGQVIKGPAQTNMKTLSWTEDDDKITVIF